MKRLDHNLVAVGTMQKLASFVSILLLALAVASPGMAQDVPVVPTAKPEAKTLDELLNAVKNGWKAERRVNKQREEEFRAARSNQKGLLDNATATLRREEARSQSLEQRYQDNEKRLAEQQEALAQKLGTLGELFGVVRQVAGDTRSNVESSLVSSEVVDDRADFLFELGKSKSLPAVTDLQRLWYVLQQEMTEQGKVSRYTTTVVGTTGEETQRQVIRAGVFNAVSEGEYLRWDPDIKKLVALGRQPAARFLETVVPFEQAGAGQLQTLAVDPSRGGILGLLVDTPTTQEQLQQGGFVGQLIMGLGAIGGALALFRWVSLFITGRKVASQRKSATANKGNPLGRVLAIAEENRSADAETLELKLDEAVMRETSKLESLIWVVKVVSVVAPLMGLLGTVTGMIRTFQAITLFGTGDPKLMAGGISEALVTTMLGLYVAVPLTLLHALVASSSRKVVDVLEEQSAGLIAMRAEEGGDIA